MGPFQNCVRQTRPPFKMAAVVKNRNFFNWPVLLYYKSKWAHLFTAATWKWVVPYILGFSVKFFFQSIYTDYANWAYFDKRSHLNLFLWNRWTKLKQTWQPWVGPFQNCVRQPNAVHSRWLLLLKIEISLVVNFCFITNQNELKF